MVHRKILDHGKEIGTQAENGGLFELRRQTARWLKYLRWSTRENGVAQKQTNKTTTKKGTSKACCVPLSLV